MLEGGKCNEDKPEKLRMRDQAFCGWIVRVGLLRGCSVIE